MSDHRFPDDITMLKAWIAQWALDAASGLACTPSSLADAGKVITRLERQLAQTIAERSAAETISNGWEERFDAMRVERDRIAEALDACEAYFDNRSDVTDGDYGIPEPNEEMRLLAMVRGARKNMEAA